MTQTAPAFTGRLATPADDDFDEVVLGRVFNARRPVRRPDAVLLARTEDDVLAGVRLAAEKGWTVAVRSGGHAWAAWSVRDGGLLIDLGDFRGIDYDAATGIVRATPSTKGGEELSPFLEERGRFFNGGHCPTVGIGGFLLQGGQGWNQRGWGWAAENLVAIDVVTADGELVRADESHNADLFWAARGAGPAFPGIVTRFHLRTRALPGGIAHTVQAFRPAEFTEVMTWMYEATHRIPGNVEIVVVGKHLPDEHGEPGFVVTGLAFGDSLEHAQASLDVFRENPALPRAIGVKDAAPATLAELREEQLRANPEDHHYLTDNVWLEGEPSDVVERIRPLFTERPAKKAFSIWMSNTPTRPLPDMAFSLHTGAYVATYCCYEDPAEEDAHRAWMAAALAEVQPVTAGQYLGDSDFTTRQLRFMTDEAYQRLQAVIAHRDPGGRFARYLAADPETLNRNHWEL
ncbi:FAD-binding oxidoreductase [Microbacterium caowuchunii]|uniref:FAD-binding oxidoreductase n=1 Tax=Microbacterium caowuchunii TaxID=2614638 RepID=UPI0012444E52|nr:FAD-binding oxidoreductase [Microbacterium caowuchunii]QEW01088.1 FAD-binding oxidoreductase [Microbacterium caowuchunii]